MKFTIGRIYLVFVLLFGCGMQAQETTIAAGSLSLLPADTTGVIQVNIPLFLKSHLYNKLQHDGDGDYDYMNFKGHLMAAGIDMEKDINEVTVALFGQSVERKDQNAVAIMNGNFDEERIVTAIRSAATEQQNSVSEEDWQGRKVYVVHDADPQGDNEDAYMTFLDNHHGLIGNREGLRHFLDYKEKGGSALEASPDWQKLLERAPRQHMLWGAFFVDRSAKELLQGNPMMASMSQIESAIFGLSSDAEQGLSLRLGMQIPEAQQAAVLATQLNGLLGMAKGMMTYQSPEIAPIIDRLRFQADSGDSIDLNLQLSPAEIDQLEQAAKKMHSPAAIDSDTEVDEEADDK